MDGIKTCKAWLNSYKSGFFIFSLGNPVTVHCGKASKFKYEVNSYSPNPYRRFVWQYDLKSKTKGVLIKLWWWYMRLMLNLIINLLGSTLITNWDTISIGLCPIVSASEEVISVSQTQLQVVTIITETLVSDQDHKIHSISNPHEELKDKNVVRILNIPHRCGESYEHPIII